MIYIPKNWFSKSENESKVYNLINKETDVIVDIGDVYNKLIEMGEHVIAEKYKQGFLIGYK